MRTSRQIVKITALFLITITLSCFFGEVSAEKAPPAGFGIMLSPSVLRLTGASGESQTATTTISNQGSETLHVKAELNDMINSLDEKGNLARQFLPPGSMPNSCAKWIQLPEIEFTIEPGSSKEVEFLVSSPQGAAGGYAAAIFFKALGSSPPQELMQDNKKPSVVVQIQPSMGLMIFFEIEGSIKRTGKLLEMSVIPPKGNEPLKISYDFENTGNTDVLLEGTFHILDENKALVAKDTLTAIRTFPGDKGSSESVWNGALSSGKYHVVVSLELGPDAQEVIVKEFDFTI